MLETLKKHDGGKTLETVIKILNELGYSVFYSVLNASNYGLPQNRERIFLVCFRKDLNIDSFKFPKANEKKISLLIFLKKILVKQR